MKPLLFVWLLLICTISARAALVVGGFSTGRAGVASVAEGPFTEELRAAVIGAIPGSRFVGLDTLTAGALSGVNVVIVGAPTFSSPIFLSSAEQTALLNFVRSGGGAVIYFDNDSYAGVPASDDANETFLDPFEINATGRVPSQSAATPIAPAHRVINGPFGTVTSLFTNFGGWFESLGPYATPLAQYDANGELALAAIAPGTLAAGSGGVVLFGDADPLVDTADGGLFGIADNRTFFLNAVTYAPEPSAISALVAGAVCAASVRRRK